MFRRPVFVGGKACDFLEQTGEVLRILEAEFVGDLSDRLVGCQNPFLGRGDQLELDVLLGRFAGFLLDQIAEIVRGKAQFSGAPFYRRQPFALGAIPRKIVVEQPFEPGQNVMIDVRTGDELPLVEAQTVLYNKESYIAKLKKAVYALLGLDHGNAVIRDCQYVNQEFSGFLVGKVIDSIIIGAICYLVTSLIGTPYALLVSVIIGVTNIIPFFGPFLGAVPCLLLILLIDPLQALYFLIFVVLLQQFDGNFLGPKILGETTGVSSFLIIISILIGGGFWGVFGMIIAVPVCAIICTVCRNFANRRLEKHHLPDDDAFYFHMDHIDPETRQAIPYQKKKIDEAEVFHFPGYRLRKALTKLATEESPVDAPYTPAKPSTEEKNSDSSDSDQK